MKSKKLLCLLLSIVMAVGLMPMAAFAAEPASAATMQYGKSIGKTTDGRFVDTKAEPGKKYKYTVLGSDNSVRTAEVAAEPATGTGNTITEQTGTGEVYYQKVTDLNALTDQPVVLVYAVEEYVWGSGYVMNWYAVNNSQTSGGRLLGTAAPGDRIDGELVANEWTVTKNDQGQLKFTNSNGAFINTRYESGWIGGSPRVDISNNQSGRNPWFNASLNTNGGTSLYNQDKDKHNFCLNGGASGELKVKSDTSGTQFYLYQKVTEPAGTQYTVETTGLDELLAKSFNQNDYTQDSWQKYADAKAAAVTAKDALENPYTDKVAADAALKAIDKAHHDLNAAINGLTEKPGTPDVPGGETCVKPEITWHRTNEPGNRREKPVQNVQHLVDRDPWLDITWKWDKVKDLKASNSTPWNAGNGTAATWSKGYEGGNWTDSSVRRFTGTFIWPEGVGMNATATIQSVNDADYQFIYDYINQPGNEELAKRYGNAKVLPINDDMYVFISKVSDGEPNTWTQTDAKNHLMFWTGTSGKGIWSQHGNTQNDWSRTEPARFDGKTATPAFHGTWPNLVDIGEGNNANVQNWDLKGQPNPMTHTDSWYTLTDTDAMMSTLNELYSGQDLSGQKMRIDIYAFDNSADGGMDKLELTLCTPKATTAQVRVNYWLDGVQDISLGSTVMTREIGEVVNLPMGTNTNELNHKKAEAVLQSSANTNVLNGEQIEKDFVVKESGNEINVVYTREIQGTKYYIYDFGMQNQYLYVDDNDSAIQNVSVECATDTIGASFSGHNITLTYTPKDALGEPVNATLVVGRKNHTNEYPITFIPASNVLYEETFITTHPESWQLTTASKKSTVADNDQTVYGYTAEYSSSTGENGAYTVTLQEQQRSDLMKFNFEGQGLDVIGSCGPNTGTAIIRINKASDGTLVKSFVVDTYYNDGQYGEIYQVPLIHVMNLPGKTPFEVQIKGVHTPRATAAAFADGMGGSPISPELYDALVEMGLTDDEIMETEFIGMDDVLGANTFALDDTAAVPAAAGPQTVSVDSFRVYRSAKKASVYAQDEQDVIYTNVMDDGITGNIAAYIEANTAGSYDVTKYEKLGGPENEIYLAPQQAVAFQLNGDVSSAQISARAVKGGVQMNDGHNNIAIGHNTEMYYDVQVQNGLIVIGNTSPAGSNSLLALGNLKAKCGITAINTENQARAVEAAVMMFGMPEPEIPEPTVPETFTAEFQLTDGAVWADETIPETDSQTAVLNAENASAALPELIVPRGMKLLGWSAKDIGLMIPAGQEVTLEQLQGFEWADAEPTVVFQPVFEALPAMTPARFHVVFQLTDGAEWDNGRFAPDEAREYNLYAGRRNLRAPEVEAPEGFEMTGWQAQEIDLTLEDEGRLTLRELKKNFTWYDMAPTITFLPVFVAEEEEVEPEPTPEVTPEPTPEVTPEPTPEVTPEPTPEVPAEPVVFRPERLDLALTSENNVYTLVVKASADVDHLTVNGDVVSEYVEKADFNEFTHIREGYQLYEIVAYDANGNASETYLR